MSLTQGNTYLKLQTRKKPKMLEENNLISPLESRNTVIEEFTGFGLSEVNNKNADEARYADNLKTDYNKALSKYSIAQKQLMEDTNLFINNNSASNSLQNSFIQMPNGAIGYVTDKNIYKHVDSPEMLESIQGKNGCPSFINQVDFTSDNYRTIGKTIGSGNEFVVGTPMKTGSSCAPTAVNLQILGASDPAENKANWLGCFDDTGDFFNKQEDLTGVSSASYILENCHTRAADTGASTYFIGAETDNSYSCFTSKPGMSTVDIEKKMQPGYIMQTSKIIFKTDKIRNTLSLVPAAGIMNNGQIAIGLIPRTVSNFGSNVKNVQIKTDMDSIDNCNALYGSRINLITANYGLNCDGTRWKVSPNNWKSNVQKSIDAGNGRTADLLISAARVDPARGCPKKFVSLYKCDPGLFDVNPKFKVPKFKVIDIPAEAAGSSAIYDCSTEYNICTSGLLTILDDGNVTVTYDDKDILYESGSSTVGIALSEYSAANGKYRRNFLKTGEYLLSNEFIGSPSGNCALMCKTEGSVTSLQIVYFTWGCNKPGVSPSTNPGEYGYVTNKKGIRATYAMQNGAIDNSGVGNVIYSDKNMNKKQYPSDMVSMSNNFTDVGKYDQSSPSMKVISNSDLDECKLECSAIDNCYGFIHNTNSKQCDLKGKTEMFPYNPNRTLSNNAKMYVRQLQLANSNSCSKTIFGSAGNIYNGMNPESNMTPDTLCQLGEATLDQLKELSEREKELTKTVDNVARYMSTLYHENNKLDNEMLQSLNQSEQDVIEYDRVVKDIKTTQQQLISVTAAEDDTSLEMISQNLKFTGWTALAAIAVIVGIKATR